MEKCLQCGNEMKIVLASIDTGKRMFVFCANDLVMFYYGDIKLDTLEMIPSEIKKDMECAATGKTEDVWVYKTVGRKGVDIEIPLHQKELYDLIGRKLKPESYQNLRNKYGIFHEIHDDFYDDFGNAMQPHEDYYEDFQHALQRSKS